MSTKIQINSLAALERLLAGEDEFAVEFRKSVLIEFEKKHIRPAVLEWTKAQVLTEADKALKNNHFPWTDLNKAVRDQIAAKGKQAVDGAITELIKSLVDSLCSEDRLTELIAARIDAKLNAEVDRRFHERMAEVAKAVGG